MNPLERVGIGVVRRAAQVGSLRVTLPDGTATTIGSGEPAAELAVVEHSAVRDVLRSGLTGFAEAHMDDRLRTPDLNALVAWGVANRARWFDHPVNRATVPIRRIWQRIKPDRRHPAVRSMNDHYNLGNDFYAAWLDETMTYSSARYSRPDQRLADAQENKYRDIAEHAGLRSGMRVLEIGCGWGGFAEYAAGQLGCEVTGITLSEEQADHARKRIAEAGLTDRVDIRIQDFRETVGRYDAIVSIEMIESVDERHWPSLFDTIAARLAPGGRAVLQIITINDGEWERYRSRADFIQQYIFPGGQVPAPKIVRAMSGRAGLSVEHVERFGLDYARTLDAWRERFEAAWPRLQSDHRLDERFRRMWNLYLVLCGAGFRMGHIDVEEWVFSHR
jgi:cyclopropane-fatty-acyl-phospholipid synthase